jgi:hypothetical protein
MRRPRVFFVCILAVMVAGAAFAGNDELVNFWKDARAKAQPRPMVGTPGSEANANKTRVGLEFGTTTRDVLAKA